MEKARGHIRTPAGLLLNIINIKLIFCLYKVQLKFLTWHQKSDRSEFPCTGSVRAVNKIINQTNNLRHGNEQEICI